MTTKIVQPEARLPSTPIVLSSQAGEISVVGSTNPHATPNLFSSEPAAETLVEFDPTVVRGSMARRSILRESEGQAIPDAQEAAAFVLPERSLEFLRERAIEFTALNEWIFLAAETLLDIEKARIATSHRIGAYERTKGGANVKVPTIDANLETLRSIMERLEVEEGACVKQLDKTLRQHPLGRLQAETNGFGAKQYGRLLGALGNPFWAGTPHDYDPKKSFPRRGPAQLWAYCGFDPINGLGRKRAKGQLANWNSAAKMRAWVIAKQVEKTPKSPYRTVYVETKVKYADAVHLVECAQCSLCKNCGNPLTQFPREHLAQYGCGTRKPAYAPPGSPLKKSHIQARALRAVAKEVLRDLYNEARDWHYGVERA